MKNIGQRTLTLADGRVLEYTVDRGKRKNIYITVKNGRVVLKLPLYADEATGESFLREKADWVLKSLRPRPSAAVIPDSFREGAEFTLAGERFTVCCELAERYFFPRFEDGRLVIAWFGRYDDIDKDSFADAQARLALRRRTEEIIRERFEKLTALTGLYPKKVTIKKLTASWGRCSSTGNISINSKIVYYPTECIDYVIIHELCHLRHMDHSAEFWALVSRYCPEWKRIRAMLG